jgi:hypothetical protein
MLRTTVGWSLAFVVVLGAVAACSSKSTDEGTGKGGNGGIVGGSSNTGGTGGTGTIGNGAGTTSTGGGTTSTAGTGTGACTDLSITCVDAVNASTCNATTGQIETFSCVEDGKGIGVISSGCTKDAINGDSCALDDFADQPCWDGAQAAAYCENLTDEQLLNVYINCFQDNKGGHAIVTCFSKYVTPTMKTADNCLSAETACIPGAVGAGGATGAGGEPAGAGGAP